MRLDEKFYTQSALDVAPLLLGNLLCRKLDSGEVLKYRITETEAYCGEEDTACHAKNGKTKRNAIMYEEGGYAYIYLCYGIHSLLNIVTGKKDHPEAVLIRGVEGYTGPGRVTKNLSIRGDLNKENLIDSDKLWIEDDGTVYEHDALPRVGINYATEYYKNIKWRFVKKNQYLGQNPG